MYKALTYTLDNQVAWITLNRPEVHNAINQQMLNEFSLITEEITRNKSIRAIVLTGAGEDFSVGGDLNDFASGNIQTNYQGLREIHRWLYRLLTFDAPLITAVKGKAAGGGCSLALAGDIILAADNAVFNTAFVRINLIPDMAGLYFLTRLVGPIKAKELVMFSESIDAKSAAYLGMVNKVVPQENLLETAQSYANGLLKAPPQAIGITKALINKGIGKGLEEMLEYEVLAQSFLIQSQDHKEGVQAFLEKRTPRYLGE